MFGTVARSRLKEGVTIDQFKEQFKDAEGPPGAVSLLVFQSANDPREIWIASAFESREAYFRNAESAEQKARFELMRDLVEGQPEWHDGEVVVARSEGRILSSS
jgi:heme-degrading monooxygenase HmoA